MTIKTKSGSVKKTLLKVRNAQLRKFDKNTLIQ